MTDIWKIEPSKPGAHEWAVLGELPHIYTVQLSDHLPAPIANAQKIHIEQPLFEEFKVGFEDASGTVHGPYDANYHDDGTLCSFAGQVNEAVPGQGVVNLEFQLTLARLEKETAPGSHPNRRTGRNSFTPWSGLATLMKLV